MNSSWLEQCEVSRSLLTRAEDGDEVTDTPRNALHIFLQRSPLASFVTEPVQSSLSLSEDVLIHPIMFQFLSCIWRVCADGRSDCEDGRSFLPESGITIGPLPMEPNHFRDCTGSKQEALWQLCTLPIHNLQLDCSTSLKIAVLCLFLDPKLTEYRRLVGDEQFSIILQGNLFGRLVKLNSVLLLATKYGFAIVEVFSVDTAAMDTSAAFRIPPSRSAFLALEIHFMADTNPPRMFPDRKAKRESTSPGYETLRDQLVDLASLHPSHVAPTGILLTGVSGVGKTRLSWSIAHTLTKSHYRTDSMVFYLSVRDLIYNAATESTIFQSLAPRLMSASLWILDDLHLLERDDSTDELSQNDTEYIHTCEALLQCIDMFKHSCFIMGIGHDAARLPVSFTKNGWLEKRVEMPSPTQRQRYSIWNDILLTAVPSEVTRQMWSCTLVVNTPGCVASDLHRIYSDAWTRFWARNPRDVVHKSFEWNDIRDAARLCVPSQLAELDVARPQVFSSDLSWKEIHSQSWKSFIGYENLKRSIFRQVVAPWRRFLAWSDGIGATGQSWIQPPAGVLFHGQSGCGKTKAAKCLASSLELSMIHVRASDILDKWLGGSEALLRSVFARARASAPCILFIDEIDAVACNRAESDSDDSSSRILSTLLNEMDGVSSGTTNGPILVVACTNRIRALDTALLRPGRLQEQFELLPPTADDVSAMLLNYLKNIPICEDVSIAAVASTLAEKKATGADIEGICRELCLSALRRVGRLDDFSLSLRQLSRAI